MSATNQPDPDSLTTVDLLRHGVCEGQDIFRGSTDVALLPKGKSQMAAAVKQHKGWDLVISSPLQRCRTFAEEFCSQNDIPLKLDERWREIDFGVWEGQKISKVWSEYPNEVRMYFFQPGSYTPPAAETVGDAKNRIINAYNDLLNLYSGKHLLVIQHGGTTRLLLTHILNSPLASATRFDVSYASLTRIRISSSPEGNFPSLVAHIPGPQVK